MGVCEVMWVSGAGIFFVMRDAWIARIANWVEG
jgi:hypothetical protein